LRNIGRLNIYTILLTEKRDFAYHSRFCKEKIYRPGIAGNEECLINEICIIAKKYASDSILCFACSDEFILSISKNKNRLPENIILNQPTYDSIVSCIDKYRFYCILEELNIPTPIFYEFEAYRTDEVNCGCLSLPFFIKPKYSHIFQKQFGIKGITCYSSEDFIKASKLLGSLSPNVFIQEIIKGNSRHHYYCDGYISKDKKKNIVFTRQRLNMFPPEWGNSTSLISVNNDILLPVLNDLEKLMKKLEYSGFYSLEVKYDETDGKFKFIELNPRSWWYNIFPSICGLNLYQVAIDDMNNQIFTDFSYRNGKRFVYLWPEIKALLRKIRSRKSGFWTSIKEFSPAMSGPIFAKDDFMPVLFRFREFIHSKLN